MLTGRQDAAAAAPALLDLGAEVAVIRDRDIGTIACTRAAPLPVTIPARPPAHAVDTVGAGDAFNAGLLAGVLDGLSLAEAIEQAQRCGAAVVGVIGDTEGFPFRHELGEFADDVRR